MLFKLPLFSLARIATFLCLCCCSLLSSVELSAQDCGTETTTATVNFFQQNVGAFEAFILTTEQQQLQRIPVRVHIGRHSNGTGGLTDDQLNTAFSQMNQRFRDANLEFFVCDKRYINNSTLYNFSKSEEYILRQSHYEQRVLNIYFFNYVYSGSTEICGYAYLPDSSRDIIVMSNQCATNGSTLAHEMGHYLGLFHTHETRFGDERVSGSNCASTGDLLCDTPADPRLSNKVSSNCNYTGNDRDIFNQLYQPDPRNLMSYSRKLCRDRFSAEQIVRMQTILQIQRSYVFNGCGGNSTPCNNATTITCGSSRSGSNFNTSDDYQRADYSCYSGSSAFDGNDVVYKTTVSGTQTLNIRLSGLSADLDLFIFNECNSNANCIATSLNSSNQSELVTIPNASGTYYIVVDGYRSFERSSFTLRVDCNNTNNGDDFFVTNAHVSDNTINRGQSITLNATQNYAGNRASLAYPDLGYLLSNDIFLSNDDIELATDVSSLSRTDRSDSESATVTIPNNIGSGTKYILFVADYNREFNETNENNNVSYVAITVNGNTGSPNLECSGSGDLSFTGNTIRIENVGIINNGSRTAGSSYVAYYLSTNTNITSSDYYLGRDLVSSLNPGQTGFESFTVNASNLNVPAGTYYVGVISDYQNDVAESNENDNACYFQSPRITLSNNNTNPCNNALTISCGSSRSGSNFSSGNDYQRSDYSCYSGSSSFNGNDVVYKTTVSGTQDLTIRLSGLSADLDLFVFKNCNSNANCIATSLGSGNQSETINISNASGTYYIVVDGYQSSERSSFNLNVSCGDDGGNNNSGNSCTDAIPLSFNTPYFGDSRTGLSNVPTYGCSDVSGFTFTGREKIHRITLPFGRTINIRMTGMTADLELFLLGSCNRNDCVDFSVNPPSTGFESIRRYLPAGTYYLVVDGYQGAADSYRIDLTSGQALAETGDNAPTTANAQVEQTESNELNLAKFELPDQKTDWLTEWSVAPNPTRGLFEINFQTTHNAPLEFQILSATGQVIVNRSLTVPSGTFRESFDLSDHPSGVYFCRINNGADYQMHKIVLLK